jgi:quinol-cytochrome oxidoreductase complex cytochrome b subunit
MSPLETGVLLVVGAVTLYVVGWLPTVRAIMVFLGILLVGTAGHLLGWLAYVVKALAGVTSVATAWAFGIALPAAALLVLLILAVYDMHPRNKASRRTFWVAAALALIIASGATTLPALSSLRASVQQGVTQSQNTLGG